MEYKGIITPMITPVKKNEIDFESIGILVDFLLRNGIEGVFPGSSTGAFTLFSMKRHWEILEFVSKNVNGKLALVAGIGRNNLEDTIETGKKAKDLGYTGAVLITPFYLKFNQDDLYRYYSMVAEKVDLDIFVYNNPDLSGNFIEPSTIARLMENFSNIVGVKDSSGDMRKFNLYFTELPRGRYIFQGRDDLLYPSLLLGASGGVCGTSNFSPLIHEIYKERSIEKHFKIVNVMKILRKYNTMSYTYLFWRLVRNKDYNDYAIFPYSELKKEEKNDIENVIKLLTI